MAVAGSSVALPTACGPAAAAAFNPATAGWFAQLGLAVGATLVTEGVKAGLSGAWKKWGPGVKEQVLDRQDDSYNWYWDDVWCHAVPPVVLARVAASKTGDPMTDRLVACVNQGKDSVVLESWAWQGLSMFVNDLTKDKTGDELARLKALCALTLVPSGVRPQKIKEDAGVMEFVTYATRSNGYVNIAWLKEPDDSRSVYVTATGIPNGANNPTTKKFPLPMQTAKGR